MSETEIAKVEPMSDEERLDKFKLDIINDANATDEQRDQANEDMRFIHVTGGMWEGFLTNDFTADRVKMEFDIVSNFLQRFLGKWSLNRVAVEYKPDDSKTSDDDAELLNGIYRADFRNFSGTIATDNAVDEAATCGYGAFKLATIFEDPEDPENEAQRIEWRPIYNAYKTVYWDEAAQRIDKRDARWCTILKPFTRESFEGVYPGKEAVSAFVPEGRDFKNLNVTTPKFIYVASRYEVIEKREKVFVYNNLRTQQVEAYNEEDHELIKDDIEADEFLVFVRERLIKTQKVEKSVFTGEAFLKPPKVIPGKWIPVVPFYGYRSYVDGAEWVRGLVRKLKDAARLFNMQISQLAENAASNGQEVPIFLRDQMDNQEIQDIWADKNNKAYLVVDAAVDADGKMIASGPVAYSKPSQLDSSTAALLEIVPSFVNDTTGGVPQETLNPDMSGKAIRALMEREDLTTAKVSKNFADAIMWSGEIYQSIAAKVYSKQRALRTIGKDGTEKETQLMKTVMDSKTGRLIETNTLHGKKFRAYSDVGPQYETLREQTVEDLKGMLEALTNVEGGQRYTSALIAVLLENITGVGLDPIKKLNRKIMLVEGLVKPENEEEEAMLAELRQQQQQPDPNQELVAAASEQQRAEARSLDSSSIQKIADARKKEAETVDIIAGIDRDDRKLVNEERDQVLQLVKDLPV